MAELFQYLSVDRRLRGKLSRFPSLLEERKGMNASSSFRRFSQNFLGVSNVCPNLCIRRFVTVFRWVGPQERLIDSRGGCFSQFLAKRLPLNQISGFVTAFGVGGAHKKWLIFLRDTTLPSLRSGSGKWLVFLIRDTTLPSYFVLVREFVQLTRLPLWKLVPVPQNGIFGPVEFCVLATFQTIELSEEARYLH